MPRKCKIVISRDAIKRGFLRKLYILPKILFWKNHKKVIKVNEIDTAAVDKGIDAARNKNRNSLDLDV